MTDADAADLTAAIRQAALELPASHVRKLAGALRLHDKPTPAARAAASSAVPVANARAHARRLVDAWATAPEMDGASVALALTAAAEAVQRLRSTQSTDVVWTGPATAEVPVRLTHDVLQEVIRSAAGCLIMVSFAAYRIPELVAEIGAAAHRGVDVRMVLEGAEASGGTLRFAASEAFSELRDTVTFYEWPPEERPTLAGGARASMHAKAAIADEHLALITSANLTGLAIAANMELGLLVSGGPAPARLARHFRQLMIDGVLRAVGK